jgi:acyl-CoA thioesterase-2
MAAVLQATVMDAADNELLDLLDLQSVGQGMFIGKPATEANTRVFGGHVVAQALAGACFTVDGWPCHSLHAYFLRPGKPGRPIEYEVAAMRDGQRFATRKVVAVQRDEVILELIASFERDEAGPEHQQAMPEAPPPESFPSEDERLARTLADAPPELHPWLQHKRPIESIHVDARNFRDRTPSSGSVRTYMRARGRLADDRNLHCCALAYASDMGSLEASVRALGWVFGDSGIQIASLDHAVWFHRPFRFDDWLLFVRDSPSVAGGRGFNRGSVFDREGKLVASIAQEGVMRRREGGDAP